MRRCAAGMAGASAPRRAVHRRASTPNAAHDGRSTARACVGGLVERQPTVSSSTAPQVDAALARPRPRTLGGPARHPDRERVEARVVDELEPAAAQAGGQVGGAAVDPAGDARAGRRGRGTRRTSRPSRPAAPGRCRCWRWPSRGGCAARGSAAPAGRRGGRRRRPTRRPGDRAATACSASRVARKPACGPAEAERHAEALRRADDDVGAQLARRRRAGCRPAGRWPRRPAPPASWTRVDDRAQVADHARRAGVLEQHAEGVAGDEVGGQVADDDLDAERLGPGRDHVDRLRVAVGVDEERRRPCAWSTRRHSVMASAAAVPSSSSEALAMSMPGEVAHHRLEVEERLEPALADLGLVRRVGRVPGRVLEHVAQDHARRDGAVVAQPDHRGEDLVAVGQRPQPGERLGLGQGVVDARAACRRGSTPGRPGRSARRATPPRGPPSMRSTSSGDGPMWRSANCSALVVTCVLRVFEGRVDGTPGRRCLRVPPLSPSRLQSCLAPVVPCA